MEANCSASRACNLSMTAILIRLGGGGLEPFHLFGKAGAQIEKPRVGERSRKTSLPASLGVMAKRERKARRNWLLFEKPRS